MSLKRLASNAVHGLRMGMASLALFQFVIGTTLSGAVPPQPAASNPYAGLAIQHVIVIIGENRSFDHVFATYQPQPGETVSNLLSKGIINADGSPGKNFSQAQQSAGTDQGPDTFLLSPATNSFAGNVLPAPLVGGPSDSYVTGDSLTLAQQSENGLSPDYYQYLISGGTGLTSKTPDTRITSVNSLPAGPFQLTNGSTFTYDSYAASPVHRFYQMWQQLNCSLARATATNPSGCAASLFPWVEVTVGARHQWRDTTFHFQHRIFVGCDDHGRGFNGHGILQCPKRRRQLLQKPGRHLLDER